MAMRRRIVSAMLGLVGLALAGAGGGCSPAIQKWSAYGLENNAALKANIQKLADKAKAGVEAEFREHVRQHMSDYRSLASGTLVDGAGKPVPMLTPAQIDRKEANLLLLVETRDANLAAVKAESETILGQVARNDQAYQTIQRVNASWWRLGQDPQMQLLLERVEAALSKQSK